MKLSVIGTGYIATRFLNLCKTYHDVEIHSILTRRDISTFTDYPFIDKLTNDSDKILGSEIVFEASNDALYADPILVKCALYGVKIATFNVELHTSNLSKNILNITNNFTECLGDQPGCFADIRSKMVSMGLDPFAFINYKRYMNYNPDLSTMEYYSNITGNNLSMVVSSTDGTKVAYEICFISNSFGLNPIDCLDCNDAQELVSVCKTKYSRDHKKISTYWLSSDLPKGISVISNLNGHSKRDLDYLGLIIDDVCLFEQKYHLCQYDCINTIRDLYYNNKVLLNGGLDRKYDVYAKAKRNIKRGELISKAIGGFEFRGEIQEIDDNLIPMLFVNNCILKEDISKNDILTMNQVQFI